MDMETFKLIAAQCMKALAGQSPQPEALERSSHIEKRCSRCLQVLSIDNFYKKGKDSGMYLPKCKTCISEINKEHNPVKKREIEALERSEPHRTKCCKKCKQRKNVWMDFAKEKHRSEDGRATICKSCKVEYVAKRRCAAKKARA